MQKQLELEQPLGDIQNRPQTQVQAQTCPCCGMQTFKLPVKIEQDALQHYLCGVLAGLPYKKEYSLYKGKIKILASELSHGDKLLLYNIQKRILVENNTQLKDVLQDICFRCVRLIPVQRITLDLGTADTEKVFQVGSQVRGALSRVLQPIDIVQARAILDKLLDPQFVSSVSQELLDRVVQTHLSALNLITSSGFDQDFYQGIPQGS